MTRALLLLDFTRDVGSRSGRFGQLGAGEHAHSRGVPSRVSRAASAARAAGDVVAWAVPSASLFERHGIPASDAEGGAIDPDYGTPAEGELTVEKQDVDAFDGTALEAELRANGVDEVVLTGISTRFVIAATAAGAIARGFRTVVAEDGCAANSADEHAEALASLPDGVTVDSLERIWPT